MIISTFRDTLLWVKAVDLMRKLKPKLLVPQHTHQYKIAASPSNFHQPNHFTLMLALLDFTINKRQALQQTVVFLTVSVTERVLFPVCHTEAASSEAASVLWVGGRGEIGC